MRRLTAGALGLALLFSACADGGSESSAEDNTGLPSATSTSFDREAEEQAVIEAYLAQLDAFYAAANPPDPDHPALAETATGPLLQGVRDRLGELRERGIGIREGDEGRGDPKVVGLESNAALVEDCVTDADVQFELESGEIVDDSVAYGRVSARLIRVRKNWLVHSISVEDLEQPCAAGS